MTDTTVRSHSACAWCRKPDATHVADDHPLPRTHPDYDAFYDANDTDLAGMTSAAPNGFGVLR